MRWRRIPPDEAPEEILPLGVRLHGHLGPFLVAGLRMGRLALRLLGHPGYRGIVAEVETGTTPPLSCLIDGIQIATGCTPGKGNLVIRDVGRPRAVFHADGKSLRVALRSSLVDEFRAAADPEGLARRVLRLPDNELFEWELSPSS
ncbi:MAG: formylmethanofuran dehydrogenase [Caldiserica bacterium]|nr:formylmethanofuran dehydrogenase [Caldisericota bacterium]